MGSLRGAGLGARAGRLIRKSTTGPQSVPLTKEDEPIALIQASRIGLETGDFFENSRDFDQLGFYTDLQPQQATLLFCDLSASSSLFDVVDAKRAIGCMNEYLQRQTDIVYRLGGTIDKYLGDGAMCRFNVPLPIGEDHVIRAAETALKMQESFAALKDSWTAEGWDVARIYSRVGVACGDVYEVAMGHGTLRSLALMGPPIGRAAHLCGAAPRDRSVIWIDEDVQERLWGHFVTRRVTNSEEEQRVSTYELIGRSVAVDQSRSLRPRQPTALRPRTLP